MFASDMPDLKADSWRGWFKANGVAKSATAFCRGQPDAKHLASRPVAVGSCWRPKQGMHVRSLCRHRVGLGRIRLAAAAAFGACCLHPSQYYVRHSGYSCPCTRKTSMLTGSLKHRDITCWPRSALLCLRNPEGRPGCCRCTVPAGLPKAILPAIRSDKDLGSCG